jgi:hypothetical protein
MKLVTILTSEKVRCWSTTQSLLTAGEGRLLRASPVTELTAGTRFATDGESSRSTNSVNEGRSRPEI